MEKIEKIIAGKKKIGLAGHMKPDGDCVGACTALYTYLTQNYKQLSVKMYLEHVPETFTYLKNVDKIETYNAMSGQEEEFDLFIALDSSDLDRLGNAIPLFQSAKETVCIDHHISNVKYAQYNYVEATASSTCEVLYEMLEEDKVDHDIAMSLYTGMIHDSGVFKYSNTSARTMEIGGKLIEKGIPFTKIIDESFYERTYLQNQILGRTLLESVLFLGGKCIFSAVRKPEIEFYQITNQDTHGIVEQLRNTRGVECAIFLYEVEDLTFKVSMRSNDIVDVSKIALYFGGGGHVKAAGCTMTGTMHDVVNNLAKHIEAQLKEAGVLA